MILLFVFMASGVKAQDNWVRYVSEVDQGFSVEVPAEMTLHRKSVSTAVGALETLAYTYEGDVDDKNKLFLINQVDYPSGTFPIDSLDLQSTFLNESIATAASRIGGKVLYANESITDGQVSYLFRLKYNEGQGVVKGYSLIVDDVFYMLQVYCHTDDSLNDEMDVFLDSFQVLRD